VLDCFLQVIFFNYLVILDASSGYILLARVLKWAYLLLLVYTCKENAHD
jgi:hypothetical protein